MDRNPTAFVGHTQFKSPRGAAVTTLTRWKLTCALFAALAGVATVRAYRSGADHNVPAKLASSSRSSLPIQFRRPIHVSGDAVGISQRDLIDRILAARSLKDVQVLADKLGTIGDDDAVDTLAPLLSDPRRGVPEALLAAFGQIGTQKAVDVLIAHVKDDRPMVRYAAISGLGASHSERAEKLLVDLSKQAGDPA